MGFIYKLENKLNGKIYIGQTMRTVEVRMKDHLYNSVSNRNKSYIDRAIGKYGINAFEVSIIEECADEKLNEREIFWIAFYNCKKPNGYNLTDGGEGCTGRVVSLKTRKKISAARMGHPVNENVREKLRIANTGKKHSIQTKAKISESRYNKRQVRCVEMNITFESIAAAAQWVNKSTSVLIKALQKISRTAGGYHWHYADELVDYSQMNIPPQRNSRSVRCVETGNIFPSIMSAAKWANIDSCTIRAALNKESRTAGNYHWSDVNNEIKNINLIETHNRIIKCIETNKIFSSISAAAIWANVNRSSIRRALKKSSYTAGGYHWIDVDAE